MSEDAWHDVLIGLDAHRWVTRGGCRNVLVAVHTVPSGQRLLDIVELIERDPRVQVVYTKAPDVFNNGVDGLLRRIGAVVIPWEQATRLSFDLAIAAAYGQLHQLHAPIVVVPHGSGYSKRTPAFNASTSPDDRPVYGLDPQRLLHNGTVIPSLIAVPHVHEFEVLRQQCPDAAKVALLAGDPCFDRLLVSHASRAAYRDALRVGDEHRLVVVASTWGPRSLFARSPELLDRLSTELPLDNYRVAALIHPAAWFCHGIRQIKSWLTDSRAAGLQLIDPFADWRPILASADAFIGDHGSLAMYAAGSGIPTILTDTPSEDLAPTSGLITLGAQSPRLDPRDSLVEQIDDAVRSFTTAARRTIAARITSVPDMSASAIRREMYRLLGLGEPAEPASFAPVAPPRRMI